MQAPSTSYEFSRQGTNGIVLRLKSRNGFRRHSTLSLGSGIVLRAILSRCRALAVVRHSSVVPDRDTDTLYRIEKQKAKLLWSGPKRLGAGCPWARWPGLSPSFLAARTDRVSELTVSRHSPFPTDKVLLKGGPKTSTAIRYRMEMG